MSILYAYGVFLFIFLIAGFASMWSVFTTNPMPAMVFFFVMLGLQIFLLGAYAPGTYEMIVNLFQFGTLPYGYTHLGV